MRRVHFSYLTDPLTGRKLTRLLELRADSREVIDGLLFFSSHWYPIIGGIPRILVGSAKNDFLQRYQSFFRKYSHSLPSKVAGEWQTALAQPQAGDKFSAHQRQTAHSFTYEWQHIYHENDFERSNYLHFTGPYLHPGLVRRKKIIDVGCGSGRFTKQPALMGATVVFGIDLGDTVETAYQLTHSLDNVAIVQCDVYHLPFNHKFNLAQSIGVLHHLPNPRLGFECLPALLRPGGRAIIWVYNRRHNNRALYFYEPLRTFTRRLPKSLLYKLCYLPAAIVHVINLLSFGRKNAPFGYYQNFDFNMKLNDTFDVLATPKSNYYLVEEIINWYKQSGLKSIAAYEHSEAGITCIGTYVS